MSVLLDVQNLEVSFKTYGGKIRAVRDLSFSLSAGEIVALVGESGSGKSVTAHSLLGLIPSPPGQIEKGKIFFEGVDLLQKPRSNWEKIRGNQISMIFQDPLTSLNPTMRIGTQIIESVQRHQKMGRKEAKAKALELLKAVRITNPEKRLEQYPYELSGGMRQRVVIAIALACDPKLLIADEPTTALDVTVQAQILDLLKEICHKSGTAILLITHDLGIVAGTCDRVLVMYAGTLVETATVKKLYERPCHPYTQGLLKSVPRLDLPKDQQLIPIAGSPPNLLKAPTGCPFFSRCPQALKLCQNHPVPWKLHSDEQAVACWLHHLPQESI